MTKKTNGCKTAAKKVAKKANGKKSRVASGQKVAPAALAKKGVGDAGTFHIYDESAKKFVPVEKARPVKLKGFESFTFFAHPAPEGHKGWIVSEAISGAKFAAGASLALARSQAQKRLDEIDAQRLGENIRTVTAKNGIAPGRALPEAPATPTAAGDLDAVGQLRGKILAALATDKPQVHFDEIAKTVGAGVREVAATLMVLELEHQVKQLPGKFWRRLEPARNGANSEKSGRGGKPRGQLSLLDAAVEILKAAKAPLAVKELTGRIFDQGLATSNGRTPHATLSASMQREIAKRGQEARFRKAGRGLYEFNA